MTPETQGESGHHSKRFRQEEIAKDRQTRYIAWLVACLIEMLKVLGSVLSISYTELSGVCL